ncbi:hypothetical protein WDV76_17090 [Xenorhabdus griffiniae]|uniref:hypothetical protein n=1 Tax=Xenorhabdus griffiniae TaxID=351672 RepID=UPI0030CBAF2A
MGEDLNLTRCKNDLPPFTTPSLGRGGCQSEVDDLNPAEEQRSGLLEWGDESMEGEPAN